MKSVFQVKIYVSEFRDQLAVLDSSVCVYCMKQSRGLESLHNLQSLDLTPLTGKNISFS